MSGDVRRLRAVAVPFVIVAAPILRTGQSTLGMYRVVVQSPATASAGEEEWL